MYPSLALLGAGANAPKGVGASTNLLDLPAASAQTGASRVYSYAFN